MTGRENDDAAESRPDEPPVDGPGAGAGGGTKDNADAGATSYDEPGGSEHGTSE